MYRKPLKAVEQVTVEGFVATSGKAATAGEMLAVGGWNGHTGNVWPCRCWEALPQSRDWRLELPPSRRSCRFKLSRGSGSFTDEMLFGVQQGDSDIFVSSQNTEAFFTPSTMWPETCSVAEVKFFRHINSQAPCDSWHLKCLQLLGRAANHYTLKTVVMHLLNTIPVSWWGRRQFLQRLGDTTHYLCCSLSERRLNHFIVGNQSLPEVIRLLPDVQTAEPLNIFHYLTGDDATYNWAVRGYHELQDFIRRIVLFGH
ncbi:inositol 1,4,5-trisphosphate receptor-interacting protein-like 1 [Pithys albifrons albifrons]|uniref:inositol 1,4,5-trisphosphate receptor-interacting protein-like 1 n=1 Tax=Pithys albifrons albifrons TaxID=3385563 RepID=UPI003A5CF842